MNTDPASEYFIKPLRDSHDRSTFSCGIEPLDQYFRDRAGQDMRRKSATTFVLIHRATGAVSAFYTLANTAVSLQQLPPEIAQKLPKYPLVPATLLGRLAVDIKLRGRGSGEFVLLDALRRSLSASDQVASFALVVDAKDEVASSFYRKYAFLALSAAKGRLFLPMKTIRQLYS